MADDATKKEPPEKPGRSLHCKNGAIGGSRTHYLSLRRRSLYPSELQPQLHEMYYSKSFPAAQSLSAPLRFVFHGLLFGNPLAAVKVRELIAAVDVIDPIDIIQRVVFTNRIKMD